MDYVNKMSVYGKRQKRWFFVKEVGVDGEMWKKKIKRPTLIQKIFGGDWSTYNTEVLW